MNFQKISKKAIRFSLEKSSADLDATHSKFGGIPALNSIEEWPMQKDGKPMSFLGQLNFTEIFEKHKQDGIDNLPEEGILMLFVDPKKIYDREDYFAFVYKNKINETTFFNVPEQELKFEERQLISDVIDTYPMHIGKEELLKLGIQENEFTKEMQNHYSETYLFDSHQQLMGYAYEIQEDPVCDVLDALNELPQFKTANDFPSYQAYMDEDKASREAIRQERIKIFAEKRKNWTFLWQIPSDYDLYGSWGDNGNMYLVIETEKLKKANFSDLKITWQCS